MHTDKKEIKCNEDSELLQEVVRDTTRNSSCFSEFRVVSRTISCSISESLLHFSFFLTVQAADYTYYLHCALCVQYPGNYTCCVIVQQISVQSTVQSPVD